MKIVGINSKMNPIEVTIEDGKIKKISPYTVKDGEELDYILPGFINIHVHGGYLFDFTFPNYEMASEYLYKIAKFDGVTSVVGTMITEDSDKIFKAIEVQKPLLKKSPGATLLGYHLEGPFISIQKKGAHDETKIIPMTESLFNRYIDSVPKLAWKIWTYAPENNDVYFVKLMRQNNIIPSIGHTMAHPKLAKEHIEEGALSVTHFNNAMPKVSKGPESLASYLLTNDEINKEVIFDGVHLNIELLKRIVNTIPQEKITMITDALHIAGMPDGEYRNLNGTILRSTNGVGYNSEGVLNGSAKRFIDSFNYARKELKLNLEFLEKITSTNQAKLLFLMKGKIEEGYDADIIMLDKEFNLKKTIIMGKVIE